jgi:hypothetical protein
MALASLAPEEREVIRRALQSTFQFFDFDFHARLGVTPEAMQALLHSWPTVDDTNDDSTACLAINNSLNDLLHGVGVSETDAIRLIGVDRAEIQRVYNKWAIVRGWTSTGPQ